MSGYQPNQPRRWPIYCHTTGGPRPDLPDGAVGVKMTLADGYRRGCSLQASSINAPTLPLDIRNYLVLPRRLLAQIAALRTALRQAEEPAPLLVCDDLPMTYKLSHAFSCPRITALKFVFWLPTFAGRPTLASTLFWLSATNTSGCTPAPH